MKTLLRAYFCLNGNHNIECFFQKINIKLNDLKIEEPERI